MLRQSQFDTLLVPMIYHHFDLGMNRVPSMRGQLFSVRTSARALSRQHLTICGLWHPPTSPAARVS